MSETVSERIARLNYSSDIVKLCIDQGNCKNVTEPIEYISASLLAFNEKPNDKYIDHIIESKEFARLEYKPFLLEFLINTSANNGIILSDKNASKILNIVNENIDDFSYETLFNLLSIIEYGTDNAALSKIAPTVWIYHNLSTHTQEARFFFKYQKFFTMETFLKRIDKLILTNKFDSAEKLIDFLPKNSDAQKISKQKLAIVLSCNNKNSLNTLKQINTNNNAINIMLLKCFVQNRDIPSSIHFASKVSDEWLNDILWKYNNIAFLDAMKQKKYQSAYQILTTSVPFNKSNFVRNQFLLGWLNLRFLGKPRDAIQHFNNILSKSKYIPSIARANYWLGRTYEMLGDTQNAEKCYNKASDMPGTFYGQAAIKKLNYNIIEIVNNKTYQKFHTYQAPDNFWSDVALILSNNSQHNLARIIFISAIHDKYETELVKNIHYGQHFLSTENNLASIKYATKLGVLTPKIANIHNIELNPFVASIIEQESSFDQIAISNVGAMGIMQIMPYTAKLVAKELKIPYNKKRLLKDVKYNLKIGTRYLSNMLRKFDGNLPMTIAAYNAGPGAVQRWASEFGDPRNMKTNEEMIDWIESITYTETRDYVLNVMANYEIQSQMSKHELGSKFSLQNH